MWPFLTPCFVSMNSFSVLLSDQNANDKAGGSPRALVRRTGGCCCKRNDFTSCAVRPGQLGHRMAWNWRAGSLGWQRVTINGVKYDPFRVGSVPCNRINDEQSGLSISAGLGYTNTGKMEGTPSELEEVPGGKQPGGMFTRRQGFNAWGFR